MKHKLGLEKKEFGFKKLLKEANHINKQAALKSVPISPAGPSGQAMRPMTFSPVAGESSGKTRST